MSLVVKESLDVNVNHGKQRGEFPFFLVSGEPHLTEGDSLSTQQFSSEYFAVPCRNVQRLLGTLKGCELLKASTKWRCPDEDEEGFQSAKQLLM